MVTAVIVICMIILEFINSVLFHFVIEAFDIFSRITSSHKFNFLMV